MTPFIAADSRAAAKAVDEITREVPTMHAELENLNQVDLATAVVLGIYQVFSSKPLTGLKISRAARLPVQANLGHLDG